MEIIAPDQQAKCVSPINVPTHGATGVFSVACSTAISASPIACLENVLNLAGYPSWNTFIPRASITEAPSTVQLDPDLQRFAEAPQHAYPGVKMRFEAVMTPGKAPTSTDLEVTVLEPIVKEGCKGYRVAWKMLGMPHFLLHTERVQEFVQETNSDGSVETQYYCWETFGGLLAYLMKYTLGGQLEDGFNRWMNGLKKVAEGK
ncbi:hypothetical protein JX265_007919 [Neoarthrinium moseri]|uniref:Polyketide cyclase/dehydrase n=1 Tax=Neoarthrinium moseri TaxID=1658444 RepID=A0A9P9WIW0_9PEZI|nr:hypothetical protein JX266_012475 [Neoarthrinium moseri]KAI1865596.1 hypothetical protein JX265_007919 [Neoarthrinium moseri]